MSAKSYTRESGRRVGVYWLLKLCFKLAFRVTLGILTRADHASRQQFAIADALTRLFAGVLVPLCVVVVILFTIHPTTTGWLEIVFFLVEVVCMWMFRPMAPLFRMKRWNHPIWAILGLADMDSLFPPRGQKSKVVMRRR